MKFSVVIAAWSEALQIGSSLKRLRQISRQSELEIIVVDGRSSDGTAEAAKDWADQVVVLDGPNRGAQFHAGAQRATGDLLLFLRGDSQPPGNWQQALERFWLTARPARAAATAFTVDYGSSASFRLASALSNVEARWFGRAGGDHGLCTTPELYRESGGFPPIHYGEDFAFCERLKKLGEIVVLKEIIWPAARRMRQIGVFRCVLSHLWRSSRGL